MATKTSPRRIATKRRQRLTAVLAPNTDPRAADLLVMDCSQVTR